MKRSVEKFLCCLVAVALVLSTMYIDTDSVIARAASQSADTTIDVYEVSYLNLIGIGGKPFTSTTCTKNEQDKLNELKSNSIKSSTTWYTLDGLWCITANSSANSVELVSFSYQGTDLDVACDIPDFINFHYINDIEEIDDTDLYTVTTSSTNGTVTSIGQAFNVGNDKSTCTSLDVTIPKRVTSISDKAFYNNTRLTSVEFEGDIQSIGKSAFEGCTRLKTLDLAGVFETVATNTIPEKCFYKCSSLENISIPETILNIGEEAFYQCNKIDYLLLSDSIKTIGDNAFAMCSNLRYLYIESSYSDWSNVVDETEQYKLIVEPIKEEPLLSKKGDTSVLGGYVYGATDVSISSKVDIDLTSVSVEKDGVSVPIVTYTNDTYGYKTNAVYFKIGNNDKGTYTIKAKDILGNELNRTLSYLSNLQDSVPPVVTISGVGSNDWYQSAVVSFYDNESYISSAELDGKAVSGSSVVCDTEGTHTITVKDAFGNTTSKTFGIDSTLPSIKGVEDNAYYKKAVDVKITEEGSGIKDITLNGNSLGSVSPVNIFETGHHTLVITDNALNSVTFNFVIDSVGPSIKDVYTGRLYNQDVTCNIQSECGIKSIQVTYKALDNSETSYYINDGDVLSNEGIYSIKLSDVLDNSNTYKLTIDKTAPAITGVSDGGYYNSEEIAVASSDTNYDYALLNGAESRNSLKIKDDGRYVYEVHDKAGNVSTVTFVRDTVAPSVVGISNKGKYKNAFNISVKDTYGIKSITLNSKSIDNGYKVSKSGSYTLVVKDMADNKTTVKFTVDLVAPVANVTSSAIYAKNIRLKVKDDYSGVSSIKLNGKAVKNKTLISKDGKYKLVLQDKYGNTSTINFKVDKTKPTCSIKNKATVKKGTKIKVSDKVAGVKSITLNKKKIKNNYKLKKKGSYTLVVIDKAGNKLTTKFKVK